MLYLVSTTTQNIDTHEIDFIYKTYSKVFQDINLFLNDIVFLFKYISNRIPLPGVETHRSTPDNVCRKHVDHFLLLFLPTSMSRVWGIREGTYIYIA